MILFLIILFIIFIWGHYGLPEKIDPHDYQNLPVERELMKGAEAYTLVGDSDVAFLLIHGFEGSPYTLKPIANLLHKQGYTVIAPLLPGHGTSIKHFKRTRYEHWSYMIESTYAQERSKYKHFFIIGFSLGGNLTLKCAISFARSMPPTGIVVIAAPVFLNGFFNGRLILQDIRLLFSGIIKELIDYIPKKQKNISVNVMNPWVGYSEVYSLACVHSLKRNISKLKRKLSQIEVPICLIQASNDRTVPSENLYYIFSRVRSKEKRAFMFTIGEEFSTRHLLFTHEQTKDKVYHYIFEFIHDCLIKFDLSSDLSRKSKITSHQTSI